MENRRHVADLRTPGGAAQAAASRLKQRFRELDTDRNGLLDRNELAGLLNYNGNSVSEKEVDNLMRCIDTNGSGQINFAEFVDFIFNGAGPSVANLEDPDNAGLGEEDVDPLSPFHAQRQALAGEDEALDELQMDLAPTRRTSKAMFVGGAEEKLKVNGGYERGSADWIIASSLGANRSEGNSMNDHSIYHRGTLAHPRRLFFGWTKERQLLGWFISATLPAEGQPVEDWLLFNPSPLAVTPDHCCATWQTPDGQRPKSVFIETPLDMKWDKGDGEAKKCLPEELWEDQQHEADMYNVNHDKGDNEDFDWECEWALEAGEFDNTPPASSDSDASADDQADGKESSAKGPKAGGVVGARSSAADKRPSGAGVESGAGKQHRRRRANVLVETHTIAPGFKVVRRKSMVVPQPKAKAMRRASTAGDDGSRGDLRAIGSEDQHAGQDATTEPEDISQYEDGNFVDHHFPPGKSSLGKASVHADGWMRLSKLHETPCLFRVVTPDSVIGDSTHGNFWFLSALAAAAEYPAWVQSMFGRTTSLAENGEYHVRLYHPGRKEFVRITVDDYVPFVQAPAGRSLSAPAFAGISGDGEIWAAVIEKACAKFCRSYEHMEWGTNAYGLLYVCGGGRSESWTRMRGPKPRDSRWKRSWTTWTGLFECEIDRERAEGVQMDGAVHNASQLWHMLRRYMEMCFPVSCDVDPACRETLGLLSDRSYFVLGAREVPAKGGKKLRMVYLRNPFGVDEWEGRWSDGDASWDENTAAKATLEFQETMDGTFWMSFYDFLKHFYQVIVVKKTMPVQGCHRTKLVGLKRALGLVGG
mmetsp:Transcript_50918/g.146273  ORF Transcript_50918/g.146273 Transcript_50918/m.146273 type:complete len:815 (-) Transcript_50918:61-2505(-)